MTKAAKNVQLGLQKADLPHQQHEHQRRRQLQQKLHLGAQAQILLFADLLPVVQKTDGAKDEGEEQNEDMHIIAVKHALKAQGQAHEGHRQDEHAAAHGGRTAFFLVPVGAFLPDLLPGLLPAEPGNIEPAEGCGKHKGQRKGRYQLDRHTGSPLRIYLRLASTLATISRSSMWCFSFPTTW